MWSLRNLVLLPLLLVAGLCAAQQGGDLQAQILYGFQTEDTNQLADLIQHLKSQIEIDATDSSLRYHLAHAEYRLGELLGEKRAQDAEAAFADCTDQLKAVLAQDVKSVEALALQSACYSNLADMKKIQAVIFRSRSTDRLNAAFKLAPRNPRVIFLMATNGLAHTDPASAEYQRAFTQLQLAAQLFEQVSATNIDVPGWGDAEAYLALGRQLQLRGDLLGARNWIERSLIVAPDFKAAQRQLALLVRH